MIAESLHAVFFASEAKNSVPYFPMKFNVAGVPHPSNVVTEV
ncbi:MAG: hypothetical protein WCB59_10605 [Candidatus Sulfotelmatobacter sp.]